MYAASVEASDGNVGRLCDLLFDDQTWIVRYLVLDSGNWLNRRRVTLPPDVIRRSEWPEHRLCITGLTRQQVIDSPRCETHVPLSQNALEEADIVDWEVFWIDIQDHPTQVTLDPHLRSVNEVIGYHTQCLEGPLGHILDFVVDDVTWTVRFLIVDTRNWLPGKHVLVAPARVSEIDGEGHKVHLTLTRETVERSPGYSNAGTFQEV
jgi:hypothetical protein